MKGEDFIALAGKLAASQSDSEAAYRTATSHAYYGAFHAARALLATLQVRVPTDHAELP